MEGADETGCQTQGRIVFRGPPYATRTTRMEKRIMSTLKVPARRLLVWAMLIGGFGSAAACGDSTLTGSSAGLEARSPEAPRMATSPTTNDKTWWAGLTAAQRGQLIVGKARSYVGNTSFAQRCNCKEAVRRWVLEASRNVVYIPSTLSNNYEWASSPVVRMVTNGRTARMGNGPVTLGYIISGDMIQMSLPGSPWLHTLIVEGVTSSGLIVVEANYRSCTVTSGRTITFVDLLNTRKVANFTVYRAISN